MEVLTEKDAEDFLEKKGFPVARRSFATNLDDTIQASKKIKFPLVLKIVSKKILHKSDVHGVKVNIKNENELKKAFEELKKIENFEGVIIQEYLEGQCVLVGLKNDATFGHVLVFGLGGVYTEILKDVSFRVCPIKGKDAIEMVKEIKSYKILEGVRGEKGVNCYAIYRVLLALSELSKKFKNIQELDINPLIVNEKYAKIIDARIVMN